MTSNNRRIVVICLACCAVAVAVSGFLAVVASESAPEPSNPNVLLTITVGEMQGDKPVPRNSYSLIAVPRDRPTRLFAGSRLPIASTTFTASSASGQGVPLTSYVYQNVGFEADVRVGYIDEHGRINIEASIEESSIGAEFQRRPSVNATQQEIRVSLKDGVPLEIARAGSNYLSIRADLLD